MSENWRPVPGYEGRYEVSDQGRVRSLDRYVRTVSRAGRESLRPVRGVLLRPVERYDGYLQVGLCGENYLVHALVAKAFLPPPPPGLHYVCHRDGSRARNAVANLRYDTPKGNSADMAVHGTLRHGTANPAAKLTPGQVLEIRRLRARGWTYADIACGLPVGERAVGKIARNERWRRV